MGAGISHAVDRVGVRQEFMVGISPECELEQAHTRQVIAFAQFDHVWRDHAQVLGDEGQVAQFLMDGIEEIFAGAGDPFAHLGCLG